MRAFSFKSIKLNDDMYIDSNEKLQKLCSKLKKAKYICLDTEFMRERSFYPELCLIQINIDGESCAVDPMVGLDLKPLLKILTGSKLVVLHSGRQDLEILYNLTGKLPKKIFDTQIAAMVCGFGEQVGYRELVRQIAGADVDKSERYTDWSRRPLYEKQLDYALADVKYLPQIYEKLEAQLKSEKRKTWLEAEEKYLIDPKNYEDDPEDSWEKLKHRDKKSCHLGVLKEITKWREIKAREVNKPRRWVMKDDTLMEIAMRKPDSAKDLKELRSFVGVSDKFIPQILEAIEAGINLPKAKQPKLPPKPKQGADQAAIDLMKLLLKIKAAENDVVPRLVAEQHDIEKFLQGEKVPFTSGWRHEVFGKYADDLANGKLGFSLKKGKLVLK
jgi:ribonuclease D